MLPLKNQFLDEFTNNQHLFISLHPIFIGRRRSWRFWCAPCICNRNYIHEVSIPTSTGNTNWVSCCFCFDFSDRVLHKSLETINDRHLSTINTIGIINDMACPRVAPLVDESEHGIEISKSNNRNVKLWKIFTVRALLKKTLVMMFNWGTMIFVYYGLTLNIGVLAGNVYLNLVLNSIVEISVILFAVIVVDRFGRKKLTLSFMAISGITGILTLFPYLYASKDQYWTITALTTFSRMCVSGASSIIYLYTCELYPTCIRNSSVGFFGAFARVGGVLSPYIMDISSLVPGRVGKSLPLMLMGITCFVSGILLIFLPETTNKPMQDTLDELTKSKHTNNR
ncbi:SLC22A15 [Acanthosepion pharaonis]|uniref:SLC22A15 n=1 Tax=Acanthosepion pharaonis TaxID=158019 RepID=A0A812AKB5_ACAPH|nr:SLC22A15 [Sepia pharaonis]